MTERTYQMMDALALACAIQRTRGKYVSIYSSIVFDENVIPEYSNKDILFFYLVPGAKPEGYVPDLKVLPEDHQQVQDIIKFYRKLTFGVLSENLNDYLKNISRILGNAECSQKDLGVISSIPNTYLRDVDRQSKDKIIKSTTGEVFGNVGDSVEVFCHLVDVHYIEKIECYAHTAVDSSGRLIEFLGKKQIGFEGDNIHVRAKIKDHREHYQTKKPLTQLNYVRIVNESY